MVADFGINREIRDAVRDHPIAIDLFSGVGGLSLGLEAAGFHVAVDVEIEDISGRYAQHNFPLSKVLSGETLGDVKNIDGSALRRHANVRTRGEIALVAGGPPCQGFSIAGKKTGVDPLNDLVDDFARIVLDARPLAFLMENVPGITTQGSKKLAACVRELRKEYDVADPEVLCAWHFGVPQTRRRVFIVGFRKDLGVTPSLPQPTHEAPNQNIALFDVSPTAWEAISDIPHVDRYVRLISGDRVPYEIEPLHEYQRMLRSDPIGAFSGVIPRSWDPSLCTNLRRTRHGDALLKTFEGLRFGQADPVSGIRRLHPHELATTIRAGTTKARGSWSAPRPLHPFQNRVLTTRECARIQSFPDWFLFHPIKWHGNRMVGNAVPPLLARAVGRHILQILGLRAQPNFNGATLIRDDSLVQSDIEAAQNSDYHKRSISQKVTSWSNRRTA